MEIVIRYTASGDTQSSLRIKDSLLQISAVIGDPIGLAVPSPKSLGIRYSSLVVETR